MKKSDSLAFERILKLRKELEEHNRRYYVENKPSISDFDYDILMNELITLEKRFPQFSSEVSPSVVVGSDIQGQNTGNQFVQVAHRIHPWRWANLHSDRRKYNRPRSGSTLQYDCAYQLHPAHSSSQHSADVHA